MFRLRGRSPTGLRLLCYLSLLTGLWIPNSILKIRKNSLLSYAIIIYELIVISVVGAQLSSSVYQFLHVKELNVTSSTTLLMPFVFNVSIFFNFFYLIVFRKKLVAIFQSLQVILNFVNFESEQSKLLKKVSKISLIYFIISATATSVVIIIIVVFLFAMYYSREMNDNKLYNEFLNETANTLGTDVEIAGQATLELNLSSLVFFCLVQTIIFMKRCCCDVIYLTMFTFITEELNFLQDCLNNVLEKKPFNSEVKICYVVMHMELTTKKKTANFNSWLHHQHETAKLSNDINDLTSPCIVVMIVCNLVNLCTAAFGVTTVYNHFAMLCATLTLCSLVIIQTVLYCYAGDQVREAGARLSEAVCRSPWMNAHPTLVGGLNLVALDCGRSFVVRGGAFFTLSLEFFASLMGAVVSYFIVLMQMK